MELHSKLPCGTPFKLDISAGSYRTTIRLMAYPFVSKLHHAEVTFEIKEATDPRYFSVTEPTLNIGSSMVGSEAPLMLKSATELMEYAERLRVHHKNLLNSSDAIYGITGAAKEGDWDLVQIYTLLLSTPLQKLSGQCNWNFRRSTEDKNHNVFDAIMQDESFKPVINAAIALHKSNYEISAEDEQLLQIGLDLAVKAGIERSKGHNFEHTLGNHVRLILLMANGIIKESNVRDYNASFIDKYKQGIDDLIELYENRTF